MAKTSKNIKKPTEEAGSLPGVDVANGDIPRILQAARLLCRTTVTPTGDVVGYRLPGLVGLQLRRLLRELPPHVEDMQEERKRLLELYATKDENGQPVIKDDIYVMTDENKAAYGREYGDVMAAAVRITNTIPASGFANVDIEPGLLIDLGDVLVE